MKSILITFLLLFSLSVFSQDEDYTENYEDYTEESRPGNGQCKGHYEGDGHPSWHPCHLDDTPQASVGSNIYIVIVIIGVGILVFKRLK